MRFVEFVALKTKLPYVTRLLIAVDKIEAIAEVDGVTKIFASGRDGAQAYSVEGTVDENVLLCCGDNGWQRLSKLLPFKLPFEPIAPNMGYRVPSGE